ncbi:MAG: helix-turn-helix domain-containing protein [Planctomycetes bacterium]|nr:helix-turn-helix domain-containing protein [Planctomycetota bacterium]
MDAGKNVLTTGEVAKICHVAPRTVSKWFDSGQLRGYRIPGSKDRRIPVEHLVRFMRAHGIPLNGLDTGRTKVLLLDGDAAFASTVQHSLTAQGSYDVAVATSAFEAGVAAHELKPDVLVVDVGLPDVVPRGLVRALRADAGLQHTQLVGVSSQPLTGEGEALRQTGFAGYLQKPFDTLTLIRTIEAALNGAGQHAGIS